MKLGHFFVFLATLTIVLSLFVLVLLQPIATYVAASTDEGTPWGSNTRVVLRSSGTEALVGGTLHADGLIAPASGSGSIEGAEVALSVTLPDGSSSAASQGNATTVGSNGEFVMDFTPDAVGEYRFTASYAGNASHAPASSTLSFSVASHRGATEFDGAVYQTFTTDNYSVNAINGALINCPSGQAVKLDAGTYLLNGIINVPAGKTLAGSTDGAGSIGTIITTDLPYGSIRNQAYINIQSGGNTVRNILTQNGYFFFGLNSHDFLIQDCEYNGPSESATGQTSLHGFFIYIASNGVYDNGQFVRCAARNAPCFGFLISADASKNSIRSGANAYSAHNWQWTDCQAYDCGIANMDNSAQFVYGCGFDFFEGFGPSDEVSGMRVSGCTANGNVADGFHIEYRMDMVDAVFKDCTANDNGQWFKLGHTSNPTTGVLIGTGFWLGGANTSESKVVNCLAENNWGYSTKGKGYGMVDSQMHTDLDGTYVQGTGAS